MKRHCNICDKIAHPKLPVVVLNVEVFTSAFNRDYSYDGKVELCMSCLEYRFGELKKHLKRDHEKV